MRILNKGSTATGYANVGSVRAARDAEEDDEDFAGTACGKRPSLIRLLAGAGAPYCTDVRCAARAAPMRSSARPDLGDTMRLVQSVWDMLLYWIGRVYSRSFWAVPPVQPAAGRAGRRG